MKIQIIEKLLFYINSFSYLLLPLSLLLFYSRRRDSIIAAIYGAIFFFPVFYGRFTPIEYRKLFLVGYTFLEYIFFVTFLYLFTKNRLVRKTIIICSVLFLVFQIIFYFSAKFLRLDSIPVGIETLLIFFFIFLFFYEQFKSQRVDFIYNNIGFWYSCGILLYLGSSFFFNILANHMEQSEVDSFWQLTLIGEILKNILFLFAIIISSKKTEDINSNKKDVPFLDMV